MLELPNYIFNNPYPKISIFLDSEIIENKTFGRNLIKFANLIGTNSLIIDFTNPKIESLKIPCDLASIENFYELRLDSSIEAPFLFATDFYIRYSNFASWILFVSFNQELAIMAFDEEIVLPVSSVFQPYATLSLEEKLIIVTDRFAEQWQGDDFIQKLKSNYKLY